MREVITVTNSNALVERLTLAYLEKTCDISSMAVEEYVKKFVDLSIKISKALEDNIPESKWLI
jgi:hypothetical protein